MRRGTRIRGTGSVSPCRVSLLGLGPAVSGWGRGGPGPGVGWGQGGVVDMCQKSGQHSPCRVCLFGLGLGWGAWALL